MKLFGDSTDKRTRMPIGSSDFEEIRKNNFYYVDKSGLLNELFEYFEKVVLITRPRRFGKTLTMSMLESFFNIEKDSADLFEGLKVSQNDILCSAWMNQYPVIFLTFKEIDGSDFEEAFENLKTYLAEAFLPYEYLLKCEKIPALYKNVIQHILDLSANITELQKCLKFLINALEIYYQKKVILLLDEYDVPIAKAADNGYYDKMLRVMRGIMQVLKDNNNLALSVITGCLRITKESIFTGTNNFLVNTIASSSLNEYFGFTEEEVIRLLDDIGAKEQFPDVKDWYDGYLFGSREIYCPWDVINYANEFLQSGNTTPRCYWVNVSENAIIRSVIRKFGDEIIDDFELLIEGVCIRKRIREDLTYDILENSSTNFWSVLYLSGYLTKVKENNSMTASTLLKIPNKEILQIFNEIIREWFETSIQTVNRSDLFKAAWDGQEEILADKITDLLLMTISFHDYREDFYHAFLAGIFTGAGYNVESNKEHGEGRSDIVIKDNRNRQVLIFEVKHSECEKVMENDCEKALEQIDHRKYAEDFRGLYKKIICYGVSFWKKRCLIKKKNN